MKRCPSYPGYSVDSDGNVFTHRRRFGCGKGKGGGVLIDWDYSKKLNPYTGHGGYLYVSVSTTRGQRSVPVHLMILDGFVGPKPKGQETRHLNGCRTDNSLPNIQYGTPADNASDTVKHGSLKGQNHPKSKLDDAMVIRIRELYATHKSVAVVARETGCSRNAIDGVVSGRTWKHV